jgi:hypothetical protein
MKDGGSESRTTASHEQTDGPGRQEPQAEQGNGEAWRNDKRSLDEWVAENQESHLGREETR